MEITGKIISILPEVAGTGKNGNWRKREYILETQSQYPKKVCFAVWGDRIDQFGIKQGDTVNVSVEIESREYNGRWYTEVKGWKINKSGTGASEEYNQERGSDFLTPPPPVEGDAVDDLPF
jgi:hypothetical protein